MEKEQGWLMKMGIAKNTEGVTISQHSKSARSTNLLNTTSLVEVKIAEGSGVFANINKKSYLKYLKREDLSERVIHLYPFV